MSCRHASCVIQSCSHAECAMFYCLLSIVYCLLSIIIKILSIMSMRHYRHLLHHQCHQCHHRQSSSFISNINVTWVTNEHHEAIDEPVNESSMSSSTVVMSGNVGCNVWQCLAVLANVNKAIVIVNVIIIVINVIVNVNVIIILS